MGAMRAVFSYLLLVLAIIGGANFSKLTLSRKGLELLSETVYGETRPLMGSWTLEILLHPAVAYAVIVLLVFLVAKEFFIRTGGAKLAINTVAFLMVTFFSAVYVLALNFPAIA